MDNTFNYLNLCSIYRTEGYANYALGSYPCFAKTLNRWGNHDANNVQRVHYEIYLMKGLDSIKANKKNNACLLNKKEIEGWLQIAKTYHPFKYKLENSEYKLEGKKYEAWRLHIDMEGNYTQHKWILTSLRGFYEYPFNMWFIDAHRLRATDPQKFRGESILNLMETIISSFPNSYQTDQSLLLPNRQFHSKNYVKRKIGEGIQYITKIYNEETTRDFKRIADAGATCLHSFDWWMNEESFAERAKIYHENYDKIKKQTKPEAV